MRSSATVFDFSLVSFKLASCVCLSPVTIFHPFMHSVAREITALHWAPSCACVWTCMSEFEHLEEICLLPWFTFRPQVFLRSCRIALCVYNMGKQRKDKGKNTCPAPVTASSHYFCYCLFQCVISRENLIFSFSERVCALSFKYITSNKSAWINLIFACCHRSPNVQVTQGPLFTLACARRRRPTHCIKGHNTNDWVYRKRQVIFSETHPPTYTRTNTHTEDSIVQTTLTTGPNTLTFQSHELTSVSWWQ